MAHRKRCQAANDQLQPPTTWCSNSLTSKFPMGCSHYSMGGGSGPYDRALLFPSSRLLFCGIPKSGITQWLQFLRFTIGAADYQSLPYFKKDTNSFYLDKLFPKVQQQLWKNYTKAILIREPAERLLSAYLDKIQNKKLEKAPFGVVNITFPEFVDILCEKNITKLPHYTVHPGLSWFSDPHWRPQAWSCGLSENVPDFDYIGSLDKAAFHTKAMLQQVGLWETHGKHYRVSEKGQKKGNAAMTWPPTLLNNESSVVVGFQQEETDTFQHNQHSHNKLEEYYTPALMKKVRELYWMDFKLWDALQEATKQGLFHGKDIAKLLNPACGG